MRAAIVAGLIWALRRVQGGKPVKRSRTLEEMTLQIAAINGGQDSLLRHIVALRAGQQALRSELARLRYEMRGEPLPYWLAEVRFAGDTYPADMAAWNAEQGGGQ